MHCRYMLLLRAIFVLFCWSKDPFPNTYIVHLYTSSKFFFQMPHSQKHMPSFAVCLLHIYDHITNFTNYFKLTFFNKTYTSWRKFFFFFFSPNVLIHSKYDIDWPLTDLLSILLNEWVKAFLVFMIPLT